MTLRIAAVWILILSAFTSFAQDTTGRKSNVHIGFIYPLSTNGALAREYTNGASMHAIAGVSRVELAFAASGVSNIITERANGLVAAGFSNHIGGVAKGVQAAGFLNYIRNEAVGLQAAGFMNITGRAKGAQLAGFANISIREVNGVQAGGFMNLAESAKAQLGGFVNIAKRVDAIQLAGFSNNAREVNTQIAGFINVAEKVKGVQFSGFINIADSSDYPIGLVNIVKNGEKALGITIDESQTTLASFRSGGRVLYGIVSAGINTQENELLWASEAGLGARWSLSRNFRLSAEATSGSITDFLDRTYLKSTVRVLASVRVGQRLEFIAGPSFNMTEYDTYEVSNGLVDNYLFTHTYQGYFFGFHLGGMAGIQLHI